MIENGQQTKNEICLAYERRKQIHATFKQRFAQRGGINPSRVSIYF